MNEVRPVTRHRKYKTEYCKNYQTLGSCPYGTRCRFIHDEVDAEDNVDDPNDIASSRPQKDQSKDGSPLTNGSHTISQQPSQVPRRSDSSREKGIFPPEPTEVPSQSSFFDHSNYLKQYQPQKLQQQRHSLNQVQSVPYDSSYPHPFPLSPFHSPHQGTAIHPTSPLSAQKSSHMPPRPSTSIQSPSHIIPANMSSAFACSPLLHSSSNMWAHVPSPNESSFRHANGIASASFGPSHPDQISRSRSHSATSLNRLDLPPLALESSAILSNLDSASHELPLASEEDDGLALSIYNNLSFDDNEPLSADDCLNHISITNRSNESPNSNSILRRLPIFLSMTDKDNNVNLDQPLLSLNSTIAVRNDLESSSDTQKQCEPIGISDQDSFPALSSSSTGRRAVSMSKDTQQPNSWASKLAIANQRPIPLSSLPSSVGFQSKGIPPQKS